MLAFFGVAGPALMLLYCISAGGHQDTLPACMSHIQIPCQAASELPAKGALANIKPALKLPANLKLSGGPVLSSIWFWASLVAIAIGFQGSPVTPCALQMTPWLHHSHWFERLSSCPAIYFIVYDPQTHAQPKF